MSNLVVGIGCLSNYNFDILDTQPLFDYHFGP